MKTRNNDEDTISERDESVRPKIMQARQDAIQLPLEQEGGAVTLRTGPRSWDQIRKRLQHVSYLVDHQGLTPTLKWLIRRLPYQLWLQLTPAGRRERRFDSRFGVQTNGIVHLSELRISSPNVKRGVSYTPTRPQMFLDLLPRLNINYEDFVFVDLGAGKGRVLLIASQFPFKRIVGVEFSPELVSVAQENLARCRNPNQRCQQIDVVCMDAADYRIPNEKALVYLYNPFGEEVIRRVAANIDFSLRAHERELYIIYLNPVHAQVFSRLPSFENVYQKADACIYRHRLKRAGAAEAINRLTQK